MYLKRLGDSIVTLPPIETLVDANNRLVNIAGTLYFNGATIGGGGSVTFVELTDVSTADLGVHDIAIQAKTTFVVTANGASAYRFDINGITDNPQVYVRAGETIAFDLTGLAGAHPFQIQTTGGVAYNTGLTHIAENGTRTTEAAAQGKVSGTLYWKVPASISGIYEYQCTAHGVMNGSIEIEPAEGSGAANSVQANLTSAISDLRANDFLTYNTLTSDYSANDGVTLLSARANDGVTLLSAYSNDTVTLLSAYSNDGVTLLSARANDFATYTALQTNINSVQANLASAGAWSTSGTDIYYASGRVSISPTVQNPASNLFVTGNVFVSGNVEIGDTLIEYSSMALKENVVALQDQLSKILLLRPVEYDKIASRSHEYGLISEEVASIAPYVVGLNNSAVQDTRIVPMLIQAVQELYVEIQDLKSKLNGKS